MGKRTVLAAENMTLGTGSGLLAFQTAAAGSAASNIRICRLEISQSGSTTLAMIRGALSTRNTAGTYTTTSTAPLVGPGAAASGLSGNTSVIGGTGRSGSASSADSGGAYTDLHYFNFPNLNGYLLKPDRDEQEGLLVPASTVFVVRFLAAPGTLTGWTCSLFLDES